MFTCLVCRTTLLTHGYLMTKSCCVSSEAVCLLCHKKWCNKTRFYSCICVEGDHSVTWRLVTVGQWKPMTFYSVRELPSFHLNDVMNIKVIDVLGLNSITDDAEHLSLSNLVALVAAAMEKTEQDKKTACQENNPYQDLEQIPKKHSTAYLDAFTVFDYDV
jgi:hypothetical protein